MNYTVYDITKDSPSLAERDIIWSVLLFGDKVQITSNMALPFLVYGDFPHYTEADKIAAYELFKDMVQTVIKWEEFDFYIKYLLQLRKKKYKTAIEMKELAGKEVWLRKTEKWFEVSLRDNLAKYNFEEIVPLTLRYTDEDEPDVTVTLPLPYLNLDPEAIVEEHFIKIITNALSQKDNLFVFDERIMPFIVNQSINQITELEVQSDGKKLPVFSEKVFNMPLCYTLKADEIKIARNEMKPVFKAFHEGIHRISKGEEDIKNGMKNLQLLLPVLQDKIENSNFAQNVRNQLTEVSYVSMHLAFCTNKNLLIILKQLDMMNEEDFLQASDIVMKESNLNSLRPFIFISHSGSKN